MKYQKSLKRRFGHNMWKGVAAMYINAMMLKSAAIDIKNKHQNNLENIARDSTQGNNVNKNYHYSMEEFYKKYDNSLTGKVGKILAGDYEEGGKRIWNWEDRVKNLEEALKEDQIPREEKRKIISIINNNSYLKRQKPEYFSRVINDLSKRTASYDDKQASTNPKSVKEYLMKHFGNNEERYREIWSKEAERVDKEVFSKMEKHLKKYSPEKIAKDYYSYVLNEIGKSKKLDNLNQVRNASILKSVISLQSDNLDAYYLLANIYFKNYFYGNALKCLQMLGEKSPEYVQRQEVLKLSEEISKKYKK